MGDTGMSDGVAVDVAIKPSTNGPMPDVLIDALSNGLKSDTGVSSTRVVESEISEASIDQDNTAPVLPLKSTAGLAAMVQASPPVEKPLLPPAMNDYQDRTATGTSLTMRSYHEEEISPALKLKRRLEDTTDLIVCPGVYDGFSARIALSIGFDALYMTGAGTTASRLGQADLGIAQLSDMRAHADMVANLDTRCPIIADMDTGYGGPLTVTMAVNQYIRANVAGFHIEDQVLTKRCGHLAGKKVVSTPVYLSRIRAAKAAITRAHSPIVLIARTDANQALGYDECITRLQAARALGADVGLLEGFKSKEQARQAVKDLHPWPLLLNIVENGQSPLITADEAREMGFRLMIFSFAGLAPAFGAIKGTYEKLKREGVTGLEGGGVSPRGIFEVCGLGDAMEVDREAGGEGFKDGI